MATAGIYASIAAEVSGEHRAAGSVMAAASTRCQVIQERTASHVPGQAIRAS
jgi:hypothetical protein